MSLITWRMDAKIAIELLLKGIGASLWFFGGITLTSNPYLGFAVVILGVIPLSVTVKKIKDKEA